MPWVEKAQPPPGGPAAARHSASSFQPAPYLSPSAQGRAGGAQWAAGRGKSLLTAEDLGRFTAAMCNSERKFSRLAAADAAAFAQGGTGF